MTDKAHILVDVVMPGKLSPEEWVIMRRHCAFGRDAIPLSARLMAAADVYDALISKRVYKPAFPHEKAVAMRYSDSEGG